MLCTIEAVWLGTKDGTDGIAQPGLPALDDLYAEFIDNGGQVWLCGACAKPRGITEEHLAKGVHHRGRGQGCRGSRRRGENRSVRLAGSG